MGKSIKNSKKPTTIFNEFFNRNNEVEYFIYTDGSKNDNGCGFVVYSPNRFEVKYKINKLNSIFSAEAYGIFYALKWVKETNVDKVGIFTDSLSVLERLKNLGLKSECNHLIGEILCILQDLIITAKKNIKFYWVPSHIGLVGNEIVDDLAKEALSNIELVTREINFKDVYGIFERKMKNQMIKYIKEYDFRKGLKGRKFVSLNDDFDFEPWFNKFELDRERISIINRIKSNHNRTKEHLFRKNITNSELCECGGIQTVYHLIWECPDASSNRESFIQSLNTKGIMRYDDICVIFNKCSMEVILRIVGFILANQIIV